MLSMLRCGVLHDYSLLGCHIYTTIRTKGIQRKLPLALKLSVTKDDGAEGDVSNFGAMATSLASTLGTGSIIAVQRQFFQVAPVLFYGCGLREF